MTHSDELLIRSIPQALAETERICSSVNVGSTKTGINMDAVRLMGEIILQTAERTKDKDSLGCAKLVVLCNARMIIRSWPVLSTACPRRMPSSMWGERSGRGETCVEPNQGSQP